MTDDVKLFIIKKGVRTITYILLNICKRVIWYAIPGCFRTNVILFHSTQSKKEFRIDNCSHEACPLQNDRTSCVSLFWGGDCCIPVPELFNSVHAFSFILQPQNTEVCLSLLVKGESHGLRFGALNRTSHIIRLAIKLSQLAKLRSSIRRNQFGFYFRIKKMK